MGAEWATHLSVAAPVKRVSDSSDNPYKSPASQDDAEDDLAAFDWLLVLGMAVVVAGAWWHSRGAGIAATVLAVPVAVRSLRVFHERRRRGIPTSRGQKVAMLFGSAIVTAVILGGAALGLFVSVVVAVGMACSNSSSAAPLVLIGGGLGTVLVTLVVGSRWVRHRWRRATSSEDERAPVATPSSAPGVAGELPVPSDEIQDRGELLPPEGPSWRALALCVAIPAALLASWQLVATVMANTEGSWSTVSVATAIIGAWIAVGVVACRWRRKQSDR